MLSMMASIAAPMILSKFGGQNQLPKQQALKAPPDVNIYEKFARPQKRRAKYYGQKSKPASVETGAYGPQSIYNSILRKQLGLFASKKA